MNNVKMIAAVSENGIIGKDNNIPWSFNEFPSDMKFFRSQTAGSTVIMGRATFESMGSKPLPKRRNIIITRSKINDVECYTSLQEALSNISNLDPVWLIGGSKIYEEGMKFANEIYLTLIPKFIEGENLVRFPWINPQKFICDTYLKLENVGLNLAPLMVAKYHNVL